MGANSLMPDLIYGSKKVPHIGRAYLHQSIALVSICRQIVPHVGLDPEQNEKLEEAVRSLNHAFDCARKAGHEENGDAKKSMEKVRDLVLEYLHTYHRADQVRRDIAKQLQALIDPKPAPNDDLQLETKFSELHEKDHHAVQQLQYLPQMLKFKLRSLTARKIDIEVWIWPDRLNSNSIQSGVRRPGNMLFEEDMVLEHVLCRVLDHGSISLARNPQFYKKFFHDGKINGKSELVQPSAVLSSCSGDVLHLVIDRQWRLVFDVAGQVEVFGNVMKGPDGMVLKSKLGNLRLAPQLLNDVDKVPVSFYSYPEIPPLQEEVTWASVIKAAEMPSSCDFLASHRLPHESPFRALDWKPIRYNNTQEILVPPQGNPSGSVLPPRTKPDPQPPSAPTKTPIPGPGKKKGISGGRLQNVAQGVDFISTNMAPISQTFREEPKPTKKPKGWFGRIFG